MLTVKCNAGELVADFQRHTANPNEFMTEVIVKFLHGTGVPCRNLFQVARASFSPLLESAQFDFNDHCTRGKLFTWAITGAPLLPLDSAPLTVRISVHDVAMI